MIDRRTLLAAAAAAGAVAVLAACGEPRGDDATPAAPGELAPRPAVSEFAAALFGLLFAPGVNHVHSPTSVLLALGLLRPGASGTVATELDDLLDATGLSDWEQWARTAIGTLRSRNATFETNGIEQRVKVLVAEAAFAAQGLQLDDEYRRSIADNFDATVDTVDFGQREKAAKTINDWAAENTDGQIEQVVDAAMLDPGTVLILANALHLAAHWTREFALDTQPAPFRRSDGSSVPATTMHTTTHGWYSDEHCGAALLRFAGERLGMAVVLPGSDPAQVVESWAAGGLDRLLGGFNQAQAVAVTLPKWEIAWHDSLNEALRELGVGALFEGGSDLDGIADQSLAVDKVVHSAVMAVDQYGVVASAVTAVAAVTSAETDIIDLVLDRPFLFVIFDIDSRLPLFIGQVADPTGG